MNEVKHERDQELAAEGQHANACLDAILSDNGSHMTLPALYRSIYKYNACGPWLSVQTWDGRWFHCEDLHKVDMYEVRYLLVGSIVEGSDAEVYADPIDLAECESPEQAVTLFNQTVEWVNDEACALWDYANDEGPEFAAMAAQWRDSMKTDNSGRQWRLIERRPGAELWRADDDDAHGFAVCLPGDEPDHATWSTTTTEAVARQWFAQ